ncbi:MAG TPA: AAA family ATPase, partial [Chloroflexota bacterium]
MPICAFCGLENSETAAYCDGCGHVLYVDRPAPPPEEPILVGRRKELDLLLAAFDDAVSGSGRLAMLAGEAGIGKTWIAREVARQAAARGAVVMWGSCQDGNAQPPYGLWAEAFGGYVRADEPDVIGQALGEGAPAISQIVPEVRALLPSVPPAPPLSPDEERLRLYEASVRFLLSIARQTPVLLVLDDLHWADPDSLGLLQNLARFAARSRILVIGTYRDVDLDHGGDHPILELLAILHRDAAFRQIPVRGLARKEVAEYLALTAGQALPSSLADTIHSQTGGNPFYVRELLRHLLEEHKILRRAGHWSIDLGPDELGIPE